MYVGPAANKNQRPLQELCPKDSGSASILDMNAKYLCIKQETLTSLIVLAYNTHGKQSTFWGGGGVLSGITLAISILWT